MKIRPHRPSPLLAPAAQGGQLGRAGSWAEFPLECPNCGGDIRLSAFRLLSECQTILAFASLRDASGDVNRAHGAVQPGGASPQAADGSFRYEPVWRYLFTHGG